jgi:hypothetical protein
MDGINSPSKLAVTSEIHNLTFAVSPKNKLRKFQISEVSIHEDKGLAKELEKRADR